MLNNGLRNRDEINMVLHNIALGNVERKTEN
jgi:hypothetical protein